MVQNTDRTMEQTMEEYDEEGYLFYQGNRFLIVYGVLQDVIVEQAQVCVPEGVRTIQRQAFFRAREEAVIETLLLPAGLRKIERLAFSELKSLRWVKILPGITKLEPGTFRNCTGLEIVLLPETLIRIESRAFEHCIRLRNLLLEKEDVSVAEDAFLGCRELDSRQVEEAIARERKRRKTEAMEEKEQRRLHYPALKFASEKENIEKEKSEKKQEENTKCKEASVVLQEASEVEEAKSTEEKSNENTKFCICDRALEYCEIGSKHIRIPDGVTKIKTGAFEKSERREELEILELPEGVTILEEKALYHLKNLSTISFPTSLSYVGAKAVEGTAWLTNRRKQHRFVCINHILISAFYDSIVQEADLPEYVQRIAPYAFYHSEIQLMKIPNTVKQIDAYAFVEADITELEFCSLETTQLHYPVIAHCHKLKEIYLAGNMKKIEENFVQDCPMLQRVCIKGTQTAVHKRAFPENVKIWRV